MQRLAVLCFGLVAYVAFLAAFLYAVLFVEGLYVPRTLDAGGALGPAGQAAAIDLLLLGLFAVQHSVMARPAFKARWTRVVHPAIERSTFVLATSIVLALIFRFWRPIPAVVWDVDGAAAILLRALSWAGFGLVLVTTFVIDHFELFGLKQTLRHAQRLPAERPAFQVRLFYRYIRHPLYLGFFVAFWSAPTMTAGHLLFSAVVTAYVLVAVRLEERDLVAEHGEAYEEYRRRVPRILPLGRRHPSGKLAPRPPRDSAGA
jgi:protein-S-isoprenylcysteine O-methyltransferase Ste14